VLPWAWAAFGFVVDVVIVQLTPAGHTSHRWVGRLVGVFIVVFVLGTQSVARALPFGLALGVSRRTYSLLSDASSQLRLQFGVRAQGPCRIHDRLRGQVQREGRYLVELHRLAVG
jgi:hypothetical protein